MEPKVVIVAFRCLSIRHGISRAVSTICAYFKRRALVITDIYNRGFTHTISNETPIFEFGRSYSSYTLLPLRVNEILRASIRIKTIAEKSGVKVLNAHGYDSLFCSCMAKLLSFGGLVVSWQIYDEEEIFSFLSRRSSRLVASLGLVDQILVLSMKMKRLVEKNLRLPNVFVLRLGVCPELLELSEKYSRGLIETPRSLRNMIGLEDQQHIRLYFHGILVPRRRIEDLLQAVAILKQELRTVRVALYVGDGLNRDLLYMHGLRQLIDGLDLADDVIFLDSLDDDEAIAFMYDYCDIFVFPCDHQSWGLAPLEAMLFRKPVIVSSGAGVSEVLARESLAEIVPPKDPRMLAISIMNMIKDERWRRKLGDRGRNFVVRNLTYVSTGRQLEELWLSACPSIRFMWLRISLDRKKRAT